MSTVSWWLAIWSMSLVTLIYSKLNPSGSKEARSRLAEKPQLFYRNVGEAPGWFVKMAYNSDLFPPNFWWHISLSLIAGAAVLGSVVSGVVLGLLGGLGVAGVGFVMLHSNQNRRYENLNRDIPEALELVARSCRSGVSVIEAMASLEAHPSCRSGALFVAVAKRVDQGESLSAGLSELVALNPSPAVRLASAALAVGAETGAAPARAVEGVAATLRDRAAIEREAQALATQAKYSAAVLVLAPIVFALFSTSADARIAEFLFRSPLGLVVLVSGIGLDALGAWWMVRLVKAP